MLRLKPASIRVGCLYYPPSPLLHPQVRRAGDKANTDAGRTCWSKQAPFRSTRREVRTRGRGPAEPATRRLEEWAGVFAGVSWR